MLHRIKLITQNTLKFIQIRFVKLKNTHKQYNLFKY